MALLTNPEIKYFVSSNKKEMYIKEFTSFYTLAFFGEG